MARAFQPNEAGFRAFLNGPEVQRGLREVMERAKGVAEAMSEHFRSADTEGDSAGANLHEHYADAFEVGDATVEFHGRHSGPRAAARLTNTSGHAAAVEVGYRGRADEPATSAHRVFGRTLEQMAAER